MKKFLSLFLCLILLFGLLPLSAPARADSSGDWEYYVYSDYTKISKYKGAGGKVTIPSTLGGKPVKEIGYSAFQDCTGLTSVTIPGSVTSIGGSAFEGCTGLTSVTIPSSVTSISGSAFRGCTRLTSVTIPGSVTSIGYSAFQDCTGLTSVTIPSSVTSIGSGAFYGCTGLTSVTIPGSVTSIGGSAFSGCTGLTKINTAADNPSYCSIDGILFSKDKATLIQYPAARTGSYTIPNSVIRIGSSAFEGCTGLTSISIPKNVTGIDSYTFYGCTGLTSVTIPNSVTSIGNCAFYGCTGLTSVTIPSSVTGIGYHAFQGCTGLTSVTIPGSVTSIGGYAFCNCTGLTSVTIPSSVAGIGYSAFQGCTGLTSISIPDSVTEIGSGAFSGCTSLTKINTAADNPSYCSIDGILFSKDKATLIQYPAARTGGYTIPNSVTEIGSGAFSGCTGLTSVTIPSSVTSIGASAFYNCSGLTSISIPDNVTSISNCAFYGCTGLTSVTIPSSVASISDSAFSGCTGLTSVTIPSSVASIGWYAFYSCTGLTDVYYGGTEEEWGGIYIDSDNGPLTSAAIHYAGPLVIDRVKANKTTATTGEKITWTATASGGFGALQYYFAVYKDGTPMAKRGYSTTRTYSYTPTEPGTYKVRVYVKDANETKLNKLSAAVTVTQGPPVVTTQPANQTVAAGATATFKVVASGNGLSYQWQYSKDGGTTWYNKTGATETSCTVTAKTAYDGFRYRCRVKNEVGTVYSNPAELTVLPKPVITTQPANQTVAAGATATFKAVASGTGLTYQWQYSKDGGTTWYNKTGATETSCTVTAKTSYDGFLYRCKVKNSAGTVYSSSAKLTVTSSAAPVISSVKADKTAAAAGTKITWTATATGGTGTLQYYFILYKDGTKVKTRSYSTTNTFSYTPTEAGTYKVRVYVKDAGDAKVNKLSAAVTVTAGAELTISSVKADKTAAAAGTKITWTATATGGTGTLQYYFILYKDGTKVKTRSYSTTNTFSYTPTEAGTYKAKVYVKDAADTKVSKLSGSVTVSVLNPTQDDPGIELTDGNPSGDAKTISFTTRNELTGGKTGTARAFTAQPLDNGYTRFSLSYSIPEQMYISVFNPPEGTLFMLESQTENAGQSGNLIFDLKNKDLNAIEEVSIKFYKSDEEVFWVFFYTDQLK